MTSLPDALGDRCPVGFREMWETCMRAHADDEAPWLVLADAADEWGMHGLAACLREPPTMKHMPYRAGRPDKYWTRWTTGDIQYRLDSDQWWLVQTESQCWHGAAPPYDGLYEFLTGEPPPAAKAKPKRKRTRKTP